MSPLSPTRPHPVTRVSRGLFALERRLLQALMAAILILTLVNIGLTIRGRPLYWAAEALVALMTLAAFVGQSMLIRTGQHPGVTLLADMLSPRAARWLRMASDLVLMGLSALLLVLAWRMFDLPGLMANWHDPLPRAIETGNFTWLEPTNTLGIAKAWLWLAPVPFFAFGGIHALARLLDPQNAATDPQEV
ncbi:TRAP transporter small permease [Pararhodobacter sp.]|uniref:TRAP transporter small permease n=1 Tax=Pararhodobacter sp. TaxID=2127056 RepID=UPI002FE2433E